MGRGDKKSRKGKIWRGSYGKSRPKQKNMELVEKLAEARKADSAANADKVAKVAVDIESTSTDKAKALDNTTTKPATPAS